MEVINKIVTIFDRENITTEQIKQHRDEIFKIINHPQRLDFLAASFCKKVIGNSGNRDFSDVDITKPAQELIKNPPEKLFSDIQVQNLENLARVM